MESQSVQESHSSVGKTQQNSGGRQNYRHYHRGGRKKRLGVDVSRDSLDFTSLVWKQNDEDDSTVESTRTGTSSDAPPSSCPSAFPTIDWNDEALLESFQQPSRPASSSVDDSDAVGEGPYQQLVLQQREERVLIDEETTARAMRWMQERKNVTMKVHSALSEPTSPQSPSILQASPSFELVADSLTVSSDSSQMHDFSVQQTAAASLCPEPKDPSFPFQSGTSPRSPQPNNSGTAVVATATKAPATSTLTPKSPRSSAAELASQKDTTNADKAFDTFVVERQLEQSPKTSHSKNEMKGSDLTRSPSAEIDKKILRSKTVPPTSPTIAEATISQDHSSKTSSIQTESSSETPPLSYMNLQDSTTFPSTTAISPPAPAIEQNSSKEPSEALKTPPRKVPDTSLVDFATPSFEPNATSVPLSTQDSLTPMTALDDSTWSPWTPQHRRETVYRDFATEVEAFEGRVSKLLEEPQGTDDTGHLELLPQDDNSLSIPTLELSKNEDDGNTHADSDGDDRTNGEESVDGDSDADDSSDLSSNGGGAAPLFELVASRSGSSWKKVRKGQPLCSESYQRASSLLNSGMDNLNSGKHDIAIQSLSIAVSIFRRSPKKAVALARTLNLLGTAYTRTRRWNQALPCLHEALMLRYEKLGRWHVDTVDTMNNIGNVYMRSGNVKWARRCYWQVYWLRQAIFGCHPSVAVSAHDLANSFRAAGRNAKARKFYGIAMKVYEELSVSKTNPAIRSLLRDIQMLRSCSEKRSKKTGPVEF